MDRRDKSIVLALIGLLVITSVAAVLAESGEPSAAPAFGGSYVEGVAGVAQDLNPLLATTNVDQDVARLAFAGLTRFDRSGAVVPDLADRFDVDADGLRWTFVLREAYWHDGQRVVADDVVYTVGLVQDRAYVGPYAEAFRGVTVQRVDARTVRFTLPDAYGPFAASTTLPLLPSHMLGGVAYAELARTTFSQRPIGTGPFRVAEVDGRQIVLSRHERFHRAQPARSRPYLDRLILRFYRDTGEALVALARGEIDGTAGLDAIDAERARGLKNVNLYSLPTNDFTALFLNVRSEKAIFRDRAVRQAMALAIDRGRVLQIAADGRGRVADEFVPPTSWAYSRDVRRYQHNASEAKALLDEADWKDHDGDGTRDKGGAALAFTLTTSDEPTRVLAASHIASDLVAIGMRVELRTVGFAELVDRVARDRAFDVILVGITAGNEPDPYAFFHSSQAKDPGYNFSGYSTLPLDRALEQARRTYDQAKRAELYAQAFQIIANDVPVIYLYFSDYLYAQHRSVNGIKIAPITDPTQRFWDVEDWYMRTQPRQ
ncbi:MAG TPA: ABC transporter substrate-binding protein [Candidatus Limnocylindria bacterium]|nr:ABC transporter substrate-binding protein [Candidatus Limnocylindria bacterium]